MFESKRAQTVRVGLALQLLATSSLLLTAGGAAATGGDDGCRLQLLHNNDGESQLIDAGSGREDFGGAANFATVVKGLRDDFGGSDTLLVSAGDNILPGPEFNASLANGIPFFDAIVYDAIGYDALIFGNHEFDSNPDPLEEFIRSFSAYRAQRERGLLGLIRGLVVPKFLSANLDFSQEPGLDRLEGGLFGRIARSWTYFRCGRKVGLIGATTPDLRSISSPRNVIIEQDVAGAVQAEIDRLTHLGVDIIVLASHLQGFSEDQAVIAQLRGLDAAIAGGGDELLANPGDLLIPGDEGTVAGPYPLLTADADGNQIPLVTGPGQYKYIGRLILDFDEDGELTGIDPVSGPVRISTVGPDATTADPEVQTNAVDPVAQFVADLDVDVIAVSEVALDGVRDNIRSMETNQGNLIADSQLAVQRALASSFGLPPADVAVANGGGIRNDTIIPAGDITELDTFDILPFSNFVTSVTVPAAQFKEIMENAVSRLLPSGSIAGQPGTGRFAQIAGFTMEVDLSGTPREGLDDGTETVAGTRVDNITLVDDAGNPIQTIVANGQVVTNAPDITIAVVDFLINGGDQYPFRGAPFTRLGVTYQRALSDYIQQDLAGLITAAEYPEGGEGRITLNTVP